MLVIVMNEPYEYAEFSLWLLPVALDRSATFKGFILEKIHFEIADLSLSLVLRQHCFSWSRLLFCTESLASGWSGARGVRQSHSLSYCQRKAIGWKKTTSVLLRSSHCLLPVLFGSAGGGWREKLSFLLGFRLPCWVRCLGRRTSSNKSWQSLLHICGNELERFSLQGPLRKGIGPIWPKFRNDTSFLHFTGHCTLIIHPLCEGGGSS